MPRLIAAIALGVSMLLGSGAAVAATPNPTPTPIAGGVSFTLSPVGNGVVAAGGQLSVSLTVTNDTSLYLPSGHFVLELGSAAITDRSALQAWLDGDTGGIRTSVVANATAPAVDPTSVTTEGLTVTVSSRGPGVYPLLARYQRPGGDLVSTSALIVPRTSGPVTSVGVVVPITAGPLSAGLLDADQLAALTAPGGSLSEQLLAVSGTTAILAVDPAIPAAIRVLGEAAPADAVAWLDQLVALPNPRFALQFGDADVAAQLQSGLSQPQQPTSLSSYLQAENFPADATPTPEPTPDATEPSDQPSYPDLETLLGIGGGRPDVYWPAGGAADSETVQKLGRLGTDDLPAMTLLPSATTTIGKGGAAVPARGSVGKDAAAALVYDSGVSAALLEASSTADNALRGRPLTSATALLALASEQVGDTPLLVTVDRGADRSRVGLRAAIAAATELQSTRPATLAELVNATPRTVALVDVEPDAVRTSAATALRTGEGEISAFATILDDPSLLTGPERAEILQLLGVGWLPDDADWALALQDHRAATAKTLDSVGILPPSHVNLAAPGAALGFWVRNDLPYPINVVLFATPDDLRLDVQRLTNVDGASASSNTRVRVPVQARVGSGEVDIDLQLRSPTSVPIGVKQTATVTVRADWEGIGIAVIVVLIGGLIAVGLVRTVLRRRSAKRASASGADDPAETTDAAGPSDAPARPDAPEHADDEGAP